MWRTIYSALDNAPTGVIVEVILVDDGSFHGQYGIDIEVAANLFRSPPVKLIRMENQSGPTQSRMAAAEIAIGDALVFLESHCECLPGWLDQLLAEIGTNQRVIAAPVVDTIHADKFDFVFTPIKKLQVGGFDWNLDIHQLSRSDRKKMKNKELVCPIRSPVLPHGIFAISRNWFFEIGAFDQHIDNFFGEGDIELSVRTWLCGGYVTVCPCSHVGHVYRNVYTTSNISSNRPKNKAQIADIWFEGVSRVHSRVSSIGNDSTS